MKTITVAVLAALVVGLVGSASADSPTLDVRVTALEAQLSTAQLSIDSLRTATEDNQQESEDHLNKRIDALYADTERARLIGACIHIATPFRKRTVTLDGKRVQVLVVEPVEKRGDRTVHWVPMIHPDCTRAPKKHRRVTEIAAPRP